ncbi:MAG: S8 family serine peptidase, partial [Chitinispirillaceae bacterium]|nr:S8 family serine peptidase [Chitinispirillaceae bacterium]
VVWAESLGVDIISTSLGYSYGFQDTIVIERENGKLDTIVDYSKSDMDGKTTIISKAAKGAIERGVLIVAAAGNEQEYGDTSICAPADVDGVIAVGAINNKGVLTTFSSLGPSADGRIKPDVVAPGSNINVPLIIEPNIPTYSGTNSGTSFAVPFISGICALVKQMFTDFKAPEIREKIYKSCKFLPSQDRVDNRYGYGIPDALIATMRSDKEIFLVVIDTGGIPFRDGIIINEKGDTLTTTNEDGVAIFLYQGDTIYICHHNKKRRIVLSSPPMWKEVSPCSLLIRILDKDGISISDVNLKYNIDNEVFTKRSDSNGIIIIESFFPVKISGYFLKTGYNSYDFSEIIEEKFKKVNIMLEVLKGPEFEVYPTVLSKKKGNSTLIMRINKNSRKSSMKVKTEIRTLSGALVWYNISFVNNEEPLINKWNIANSKVSPGSYFVVISCENKNFYQRVIISE